MTLPDHLRTVRLSAFLLAGRRFYLAALTPLLWSAFHVLMLRTGGREQGFEPANAQNFLIGLPMTVLAIFLGTRIIAGEIDARRLEIAYTVPGGSQRIWFSKLFAALGVLLLSELVLALFTWIFFTSFPPSALYGAFQGAVFFLVLSMGLATLAKSEVTGALLSVALLLLSTVISQTRFSPFFNPLAQGRAEPEQILGWAIQNRIGFLLLIAALLALAFGHAERREKMLSR